MSNNEEFLLKLKQIFKIEAQENMQVVSDAIINLEKNPQDKESIEIILRQAHSLKGSARSVAITDIVNICQSFESAFVKLKNNQITLSEHFFNVIYQTIDMLKKILENPDKKHSIYPVIKELNELLKPNKIVFSDKNIKKEVIENNNIPEKVDIKEKEDLDQPTLSLKTLETVRIETWKLDKLLNQSEDMLSIKLNYEEQFKLIGNNKDNLEDYLTEQSKFHSEIKKIIQGFRNFDINIFNKINEMIEISNRKEKILREEFDNLIEQSEEIKNETASKITDLLKEVKTTLMLPFSGILSSFPLMVRELSKSLNKDINLVINGSVIEIDKRILEEIKDPLIHLVRNSIDHGLEVPEERKNKDIQGNIKIDIQQTDNNKVEIRIFDDGKGLDYQKIKDKLISLQIISHFEANKLSENEIKSYIFHSGFSTSSIITEISGRGLGLAIVKERIDKIGGDVKVNSEYGKYTEFLISLPLTLSTFRGLIVRTSQKLFVIPINNIIQVLRVKVSDIKKIDGKMTIKNNNQILSFFYLSDILKIPYFKQEKTQEYIQVVIISALDKSIGLWVDEVLYEQEVMVKSLGKQLLRVRNISGLTILGSGQNVPLLNVRDILKSVSKENYSYKEQDVFKKEVKKSKILIAEDSITSRTLLTNILESAGYEVKTAVDGLVAYNILEREKFDLLISDVEMPKMDGFELTSKVRQNEKISQIPIILITSLSSREHKEKGIEAGANAYIVKSELEQENLLNIIPRLL